MHRTRPIITCSIALAALAALVGCGGSGSSASKKTTIPLGGTTTPATKGAAYHPKIDPRLFTDHLTNRYFPLTPGSTMIYTGTRDGSPEQVNVTVARGGKTIMGVRCIVVSDIVTSNNTLVEKTTDWYAQDAAGNVWYFGEDTREYKNGNLTSTAGTWEAGVDGAQPGIVIHAAPKPGPTYRQEYRPGVAEDMARVLTVNTIVRVPAGTYRHSVETYDTDPLHPDKIENKWYAPGVGLVKANRIGGSHHEVIRLVKRTAG